MVPQAKVVLTDQEKGFTFTAVTNNEGRFLFSAVPPSDYRLTSDLPGFETAIRTGVRVNVNQKVTANLPLKVAGAVQIVNVGASDLLSTEDATTGLTINRKAINDLPLIDRYAMDLTMLTPGVTETDDQCGTSRGPHTDRVVRWLTSRSRLVRPMK